MLQRGCNLQLVRDQMSKFCEITKINESLQDGSQTMSQVNRFCPENIDSSIHPMIAKMTIVNSSDV